MFFANRRSILKANGEVLGVAFTSDGRQDEEINVRFGKASAVVCDLHRFKI